MEPGGLRGSVTLPRAAPAGRGGGGARRGGCRVASLRLWVAGRLDGAGIPRRREGPRAHEGGVATVRTGAVYCPGGRGPCPMPEPSRGRGRCRCRRGRRPKGMPGARGAVLPCPRERGGAVRCRALRGRGGVATRSPPPESSRWEPRERLLSGGRGELGGAWARLRRVCRGALQREVPVARGRWPVQRGRNQRAARCRRWGLGSSRSSLPSGVSASRGTLAAPPGERGTCGGRRCSALPSLQPKALWRKENKWGYQGLSPSELSGETLEVNNRIGNYTENENPDFSSLPMQ